MEIDGNASKGWRFVRRNVRIFGPIRAFAAAARRYAWISWKDGRRIEKGNRDRRHTRKSLAILLSTPPWISLDQAMTEKGGCNEYIFPSINQTSYISSFHPFPGSLPAFLPVSPFIRYSFFLRLEYSSPRSSLSSTFKCTLFDLTILILSRNSYCAPFLAVSLTRKLFDSRAVFTLARFLFSLFRNIFPRGIATVEITMFLVSSSTMSETVTPSNFFGYKLISPTWPAMRTFCDQSRFFVAMSFVEI